MRTRAWLAAAVTLCLMLGAPVSKAVGAGASPSTTVPVVLTDTVPDWVVVSEGAPANVAQATDVLSVRYAWHPNARMLTITFRMALLDYDYTYEFGSLVTSGSRTGQVYTSTNSSINMRRSLDGPFLVCVNTKMRTDWTTNTVTQQIPYWCLPFRKGSFSPYVTTTSNRRVPLGADSVPLSTPVYTFRVPGSVSR